MPALKRFIPITLIALVLLMSGAAIGRYELLPISVWADVVKVWRQNLRDRWYGADSRIQRTLDSNYTAGNGAPAPARRDIDTSLLPLRMEILSLSKTGQFADSEAAGAGAMTSVEGRLFIMDSIGNIFAVRDSVLQKMDYPAIPNNIRELVRASVDPVPLGRTRALYLAYDPVRSTIFTTLKRYSTSSGHVRFNVSALHIDKSTRQAVGAWETVFESEDIPDEASRRGSNGGRIIVGGDTVYFSIGDFGWGQVPRAPFEFTAQDPKSSFGKVFAYDLRTKTVRMMSSGHRNVQGLVWTSNGQLIDAEQGPEGGDELNLVADGHNYGWPYRTYGTYYGTFSWPIQRPPGGLTEPLFAWVPAVAISPLIQISSFNSRWDGDLLAGSLKGRSLFRLKLIEGRVVFAEPIWIGHRIRDIVELPGEIALMVDDPAVLRLRVDSERLSTNNKMQKDIEWTELAKCVSCHHFGDTNPSHQAPTLSNLIGKPIAGDEFLLYSAALKKKVGVWDEKTLAAYIKNPGTFAPGTSMPSVDLSDSDVRRIVALLTPRR